MAFILRTYAHSAIRDAATPTKGAIAVPGCGASAAIAGSSLAAVRPGKGPS